MVAEARAGRSADVGAAVTGLVLACHPLPCLAVTLFATSYAGTIGLPAADVALLAVAVLTGQLSIGWCNDAVDAGRDVAAGRRDKPVARGQVSRGTVGTAAAVALLACAAGSLALGVVPGVLHLAAVAAGWAYDLGLKSTAASALAYLVAFGLLPAVATTALPDPRWPHPSVTVGAALLGLAAHFANTVGDSAADAATGVRGLPQRLGPRRSLQVTALGVGAAALVLLAGVLGGPGRGSAAGTGLLAVGAVASLAGLALSLAVGPGHSPGHSPGHGTGHSTGTAADGIAAGRTAFRLTLAAVALVVLGLLLATPGRAG